jgi:integrase
MPKTRATKGIYRRGKTYWITYKGLDGVQKFESARSTLKADAEYLLACRRKEVAEGTPPAVPTRKQYSTTFADLAKRYLEFCAAQRDIKSKAGRVNQLVKEFGNVKLVSFTLATVEGYQGKKLAEPRPARKLNGVARLPMASASVNRLLATLKNMFTKAEQWGLVPEQTLKTVRRVKLARETAGRLRFLTGDEARRLIDSCGPGLRGIVSFALHTGCRREEILSLKWEDVDLKHGFIHLPKTKNGEGRDIPINAELKETLRRIVRRLDSPFVFLNPETGNRYRDIKRSFATACRKTGIRDFRFHDLRHTFASHLVMAGVDITTVSRLMGHKSLTMTLRYSHLAPDHLQRAVDFLNYQTTAPEIRAAVNTGT